MDHQDFIAMIKLRDLQYLVAVDQYRHFGKAAQACAVSQPTLSGQILKLENQLGIQLIERHNRKVMATSAGRVLIDKARAIMHNVQDFECSAKALLDPFNTEVHLGLIPTLAPYLLPHIMGALNEQLPEAKFFLHEDKTQSLIEKLKSGELDCLILPHMADDEQLEYYHLFYEELELAMSQRHPLAAGNDIQLDDIRDETILTLEDGHCLQQHTMDYCFFAKQNQDQRFKATSLETLRYMVASDMGLTLIPKLAILGREDQGVHYHTFKENPPKRQVVLAMRSEFHNQSLIRKMVSTIRQATDVLMPEDTAAIA